MQWSLGMSVASSNCRNLNSPFVTVLLKVAAPSGTVTEHSFEMTLPEFKVRIDSSVWTLIIVDIWCATVAYSILFILECMMTSTTSDQKMENLVSKCSVWNRKLSVNAVAWPLGRPCAGKINGPTISLQYFWWSVNASNNSWNGLCILVYLIGLTSLWIFC